MERKGLLQGTLDLLILRIIACEPLHGWGIMQRLRLLTDGLFQATPGSLFPALQRLEDNGWATGSWNATEHNRRAKYYAITKSGRKQLAREEASWKAITLAVSKVLEGA